jgi:hypothetical protein
MSNVIVSPTLILPRILPPGSLHAVLTLADSLTIITASPLASGFSQSLRALTSCHLSGQTISNADQPGSLIYFFHLLGFYHLVLRRQGFFSLDGAPSPGDQRRRLLTLNNGEISVLIVTERPKLNVPFQQVGLVPSIVQLHALSCIVQLSEGLTHQQNPAEPLQRNPKFFKADQRTAQALAENITQTLFRVATQEERISLTRQHHEVLVMFRQQPNQRQRQLPDADESVPGVFYHDNLHAFKSLRGGPDAPWEGLGRPPPLLIVSTTRRAHSPVDEDNEGDIISEGETVPSPPWGQVHD